LNIENEQEHSTTYNHEYFMGLFFKLSHGFLHSQLTRVDIIKLEVIV